MLTIMPLTSIAEVSPRCDLAGLLGAAILALGQSAEPGDTLVITQKIVSKAEGATRRLSDIHPGAEAIRMAQVTGKDPRLVQIVIDESVAIVRAAPGVLIARHRSGHVMANAGIDRSNIGNGDEDIVLLLPADADRSAERLRADLAARFGWHGAVVISDSFGRPWRMGVTNVAIGAAGFPALIDRRGDVDRDGRRLEVTQIAAADLVAAAAGLVMGEANEGVPAALIRGYAPGDAPRPARHLVRPLAEDLFA